MDQFLDDIQIVEEKQPLVRAEHGKRLINYIVDVIFYYVVFIGLGILLAFMSPEVAVSLTDDMGGGLQGRLFSLLFYGVLMGTVEGALKGKTLGKYLTNTRAVHTDGSLLTFEKGFMRGLCRAIPFNALSALGSMCIPWHDKWTDTMVIDENVSKFTPKKRNGLY